MRYIASCSFGKDSLAAIIECERRGLHIDRALYCRIMFDAETSAELPEHEEFIHCKAIPLLQSRYGIETEIVQADVSYCDCFWRQFKRSKKYGKGAIWGFPCLTAPWCNTYLKVNILDKWAKMLVLDKASPVKFNTKGKTLSDFDRRFAEEERQLRFDFK